MMRYGYRFLLGLSVVLVLTAAGTAQAPPQPPHEVYGEVTESGSPVDGIDVEATIDGTVIDTATTDSNGEYVVQVPAEYEGQTFTVTIDADASETYTMTVGGSDEFDATVSTSSGTTTPSISVSLDDTSVEEGEQTTVTADVTNAGSNPSYDWSLLDDPTGAVSLTDTDEQTVTFDAPAVDSDTAVTIEVEATRSGSTDTAEATVTILNTTTPGDGPTDPPGEQNDTQQPDQTANVTVPAQGPAQAMLSSVQAGQQIRVNVQDTQDRQSAVDRVSFNARSDSDSASVSVEDLGDTRPDDVQDDAGSTVHSYHDISVTGFDDTEVDDGRVTFSVDKSFLQERDRDPGDVVMRRYVEDTWETLETDQLSEREDSYRFEAETPGFSYYAIALTEQDPTATRFTVSDVTVRPLEAEAPFNLSIEATVTNDGEQEATEQLAVMIDDTVIHTEAVSLAPGDQTTVSVQHLVEEPGRYVVRIGAQATTITATGDRRVHPIFAVAIGFLILIALLAYTREQRVRAWLSQQTDG